MIYMESATNPTLAVPDTQKIVERTKAKNKEVIVVVDNAFLSPINCRPLDHGVDIVVESISKFINCHSDVIMGFTVTKNEDIHKRLTDISMYYGEIVFSF